jgi:hypothetical protein
MLSEANGDNEFISCNAVYFHMQVDGMQSIAECTKRNK